MAAGKMAAREAQQSVARPTQNCDTERHFRNRKIHRTRIVTVKDSLFDMARENDNFSGMTIILFFHKTR
jgi:hypothetical protein